MITDNKLIYALQKIRLAQKTLSEANSLISEIIADQTHEEIANARNDDFDNEQELIALCNISNSIDDVQNLLDKNTLAATDLLSASLMQYLDGK